MAGSVYDQPGARAGRCRYRFQLATGGTGQRDRFNGGFQRRLTDEWRNRRWWSDLEFGCAANDAIDDNLAFPKKGGVSCHGGTLRQQRLSTRIGRDDMSSCKTAARNLDSDIAHENGPGGFDR